MYIRTKDGIVAVNRERGNYQFNDKTGFYYTSYAGINYYDIEPKENLEELCDEFVFVNKVGNFDKSYVIHYNMPNHIFTEPTIKEKIAYIKKYYKDELDKIRGAIYTDEGLIYRAKFNESGDLELI